MFTVLSGFPPSHFCPVVISPSSRPISLRAPLGVGKFKEEVAGNGQIVAAQSKALNVRLVQLTHCDRQS